MPKAIRVHEYGGPEVMRYEEVEVGAPGPGRIRVRQTAVGVNFIDIYFRSGLYKAPQLPFTPGNEGAGEVVAVGEGVSGLAVGDRVAYGSASGTYAEEVVVEARMAVKVPEGIDDATAAAMMLKGLTAQYLLRRTYPVKAGDTILFHAAAGGVGLIATQWAKHLGATVIGTVGSPDKAELARQNGCDHVILYRDEDFAARVKEITDGKGCAVVYDGVGQATYPASLDCLRPFGMFVSFGNASGVISDFNLALLGQKGSLYATRPTLFTHVADRATLEAMAEDLFGVVTSGAVTIPVHSRAPLADAVQVHRDLAGRQTTGATVLLP
ncbi:MULTISPECIES: quinone oxidoreductase family protein [Methylobacterium]|jgi:NADPH2:quinone reductase|uniref:Quinone oxidoreductase 1 n=1 Tax=Methylobacterium isbiliense TaxID=315478 RepID=A0ABQ4SA71_9HYPH|nr:MULTISPECIES: quinone oxidoreductase [Methylobacterium]MBY0294625.1 quinone oxidoreductase [Methylobacterium sp.]MDN3625506.1 quinone oxidoreductase [Methylobacterium isbiliense]GJD98688.1 Quinone oxidoreductase 1 [Methylobacterium isbiliense]